MSGSTAKAHANIAVVKYWGKFPGDHDLNIPAVPSISVTLNALSTTTEVVFDDTLQDDIVLLNGEPASPKDVRRISAFLDRVRSRASITDRATVSTSNDFPTAAGLASSASGFAALAVAAARATSLTLSKTELSILARQGSGSAARSVFGGYVKMHATDSSETSYAEQIAPADHWDLSCVICLTTTGPKKIGSTEAMERTRHTAPYYDAWIADTKKDAELAAKAILDRAFDDLATIAERSCLRMHACAMAADPGILYWRPETVALIHAVRELRDEIPCFFTIDAGPHVKVFCKTEHADALTERLESLDATRAVICSGVGGEPVVS